MINDDLKCLLDYIVMDKILSNGFKEGLNNKIKSGLGYKKFSFLG
jgi:hypothetical protein